ncbi:protein timeless homolog isoform X1 [Polypterus senegalus]|uniref:protein timeless homolog isoform X1 n=1 Tax=Polypterus senegalus TaxID=55291 RepID=UPI001962804E|nr:protein timeless homolog isoform X1 [Polypterus senegalus]
MMNCELLATCSALGYLEGDTYHREPDCLESVKDLIRYLRHEDDARDIRQQLGAGQIVQNDLLPLITQHHEEKGLFDACIRLMVNLTQPALLCFGKVPDEPATRHNFLQVVSYLQDYKQAFADEKVFGVLSEKLYNLLQLDWEQRQEEDTLLIERILLLVRNVLHVPADPKEEQSVDDDASVHDKLLWAIHISGMDDLIKFLGSCPSEQQWSMHVLEIISLMFRDQIPEQLSSAGQARSVKEKEKDTQDLEILRQKEIAEKRNRILQRGTRHSRFGGSYVVQGLKSIGDKDIIYHKGLHNFKNYSHDTGKEIRKVPKRQQMARDAEMKRRSALNVRIFLKEFCIDFLENCYNRLMYQVKDNLIRERAEQHDETYYLWAVSFFMAFNRCHHFKPELVSETVSIRTFHFIEQNLTNYYEMMLTDRKEALSWARRMHLALKAYQELLKTVSEMDQSKNENVRESAGVIKSNIFYLMEYREIFLTLLRKFDETKQPRSYLKDLVETTHIFVRMLERYCKGRSNLIVQKKKVKHKKKPKSQSTGSEKTESSPEILEEIWQTVYQELQTSGFQVIESMMDTVIPFDAASEVPLEEQRIEAMVRIQDALMNRQGCKALGLLKAARDVWPEGDVFGSPNLEPEEELQLLKQILHASLPRSTVPEPEEDDDEGGEGMVEEELAPVRVSETEFNLFDYIKRFASANILKPYILLLKNYQQNSSHTNHCIVRMLHRVAYDLKMEALLFQLSVFFLFNKILGDPAAGAYKELVTFVKFVVNRFFILSAQNNKAYVELLFWKNIGVVREMAEGYQKPGEEDGSKKKIKWTEEEENELRELYFQHSISGENADVIEIIIPLLQNPNRTRKQVVSHLVQMGLVNSAKDLKKERKGTRIVLWTEDQELELQTLFEKFRESDDILGNIMKHITAKRSRARLVEKLLSLGLISERKELYKKRRKQPTVKLSGMTEDDFFKEIEGEFDNGVSDDEEPEEELEESDYEIEDEMPKKQNSKERRKTREFSVKPPHVVREIVEQIHNEGMLGPLQWLQSCLKRTADDRETDAGCLQAVPLVPLTEENEDAMENKPFQRLLKKLGIRPPANEQETFWRIPNNISPSQLRDIASSLSFLGEAEHETEVPDQETTPTVTKERLEDNEQEQNEQRVQAMQALALARKKKQQQNCTAEPLQCIQQAASDSDSDAEASSRQKTRVATKTSVKRGRVLESDDENWDDTADTTQVTVDEPELDSDVETRPAPAKRRRQRIEDDDDDED